MQEAIDTGSTYNELPLLITGSGSVTVTEPDRCPGGSPDYKIVNCVGGTGRLVFQEREIQLKEGVAILYFSHTASISCEISETLSIKYLTFTGYLLPAFLQALHIANLTVFQLDPAPQMLIDEIILSQQSTLQERIFTGSALLYMLLIKLKLSKDLYLVPERKEHTPKLSSILTYIKQNYHLDISLSMLAGQLYITEQHLNRMFKKEYAMTPLDFLTRYRLLKAKEMLIHEDAMTANDIAKAVGFNSASYFGSVFKKHEGCSPMVLRKSYKASKSNSAIEASR
ncbi:hypothetical protein BBD42_19525 [Paenibacillus sp. BIHB 4019]|uniref:HTH araC/xylS-type domain-containing protein n=1 Tax=Paenibacillus sp. BIHB 4019 TaxID=1870819 RepID=A0A1B2DL31_9BACL|nr:AraC family transcriptional regulator [Paenibacillus sp. BIHB 4019]ANY68416.1 hypothetical protein BBD42_19525 [Paenibacillus sp. BIHB 4019]